MKTAPMMIAMLCLALLTAGFSACSTGGSVADKHVQIATACESIASGLDVVTAGYEAGRIKKTDLQRAVYIATPTKTFCEPEPVVSLSADNFRTLTVAALNITLAATAAKKGATP